MIAADNTVRQEAVEKTDPSWSWTHQVKEPFQLEGATLARYLAWWSSETGKSTNFQSKADATTASELVLHGSLDGLSLEAGLTAVLASSGFHVVDSTENQVIFAR